MPFESCQDTLTYMNGDPTNTSIGQIEEAAMTTKKVLVLLVLTSLLGCVSPEFKRLYTEGTEALEAGNIELCIELLEQARELNPDYSSYTRNNLASCYYKAGRESEGWFELRQAVLMNPMNKPANQHLLIRWAEFVNAGTLAAGTSSAEILSAMGQPDVRAISDDGSEWWNYGSMTLQFQNGKLMGSASQIPPDPLFVAARQGDISQLETLLMGGSDPNMRDSDGGTPLMAACEGERNTAIVRSGSLRMTPTSGPGNPDAVRMLMSHGADPNLVDKWEKSALCRAALYNREQTIEVLLANGADPNLCSPSSLHVAAYKGYLGAVKRLLEASAHVDSRNEHGETPLMSSSYRGHVEIVIALLDAGADVNASDTGGHTPLSNAAFQGQSEVVRSLIKRGARIDDKDDEGKDALAIAKEGGHTQVIEILTTAFMEGPQSK